jgi:signal peptidase II
MPDAGPPPSTPPSASGDIGSAASETPSAAPPPPPAAALLPGLQSETRVPKSKIQRLLAYRLLLILSTFILVLDQTTKFWVVTHIPFDSLHSHDVGQDIVVVPGFFWLIHVGNTGAAWSMFAGQSLLLATLAFATLAAIAWWRHTLGLRERGTQFAFGLLCGGIVGNLLDRLAHGHVTDFIDLHFGSYIYPTFNVADSGICVGVFVYIVRSLRSPG